MSAPSREQHGHAPDTHTTTGFGTYLLIFLALLVFTGLTVAASRVDLGALNTPIAMAIASIKAALVILFFMHAIHSTRLTWVVIIASFVWLGVLFVLTFADYLTRAWAMY
jgi:cytochrome c oxidase subunit 4